MKPTYRVMINGEDHSLWCAANHKTLEWCEENGDRLCQEYENATWFIEQEQPLFFGYNETEYGEYEEYDDDYYSF